MISRSAGEGRAGLFRGGWLALAVAALVAGQWWLPSAVPAARAVAPENVDLVARVSSATVVQPSGGGAAVRARVAERELALPFGSRVGYELELPPFAELVAEASRCGGSATGRLEVRWRPAGGDERLLCADFDALPTLRAALGNAAPQRGRLTLAATATRVLDPLAGGVVMVGPRVVAGARPEPRIGGASGGARAGAPNVIVLVIDALRADHLGCYGSDRGATPSLDRFAAGSVVFKNAQAQAPLTNPAVASIFTGLWPQRHRVTGVGSRLPGKARTLAEALAAGGVATAAVVANGNIDAAHGFAQGFEHFKYLRDLRPGEYHARADDVNDAVLDWLDREPRRPFFLYVHTLGPHSPYLPQEPFRSRFAAGVTDPELGSNAWQRRLERTGEVPPPEVVAAVGALYAAEVAESDAAFGALLWALERRRVCEESVLVVLSDHGEELFDHGGFGHGTHLHAEVLDIPLLVRLPHGRGARRVEQVVGQADLMPTVLALYGLAPAAPTDGHSLLPLCGPIPPADWPNRAVSHLERRGRAAVSLLAPPWKLILEKRDERDVPVLFDRRADRGERHDVAARQPGEAGALASSLRALLGPAPGALPAAAAVPPVDEETREQLRALGYD